MTLVLTAKHLFKLDPCSRGVAIFEREFPKGIEISRDGLAHARQTIPEELLWLRTRMDFMGAGDDAFITAVSSLIKDDLFWMYPNDPLYDGSYGMPVEGAGLAWMYPGDPLYA